MHRNLAVVTGLAFACLASQATANMTTVACPGYLVGLTDEVAIQGEIASGTRTAFEAEVCSRSSGLAEGIENAASRPVFIEEFGISTRVLIIPTSDDK